MPRPPRVQLEGGIYHVYARGAVKQAIFADNRDRRKYLETLWRVIGQTSWRCLGYCLMGTHMHLLVETPTPNLAKGMQRLQGAYAHAFNRRHAKAGHVFGARYGATLIKNDPHLWVTVSYIDRNPVEAGFCKTPAGWPWGSHAAIAAGVTPPCVDVPRLLSFFSAMGGDPRERYLQYVAAEPKRI